MTICSPYCNPHAARFGTAVVKLEHFVSHTKLKPQKILPFPSRNLLYKALLLRATSSIVLPERSSASLQCASHVCVSVTYIHGNAGVLYVTYTPHSKFLTILCRPYQRSSSYLVLHKEKKELFIC